MEPPLAEEPRVEGPPKEPIPMPSRGGIEDWSRKAGEWMRRARVEAQRLAELLKTARTEEGRQRNLAPLLLVAAGGGFVLGLALGWRRGGRR